MRLYITTLSLEDLARKIEAILDSEICKNDYIAAYYVKVKWATEDSEPECISWIPYARCKSKATFLNYDDTTRVFDQNNWLHCRR